MNWFRSWQRLQLPVLIASIGIVAAGWTSYLNAAAAPGPLPEPTAAPLPTASLLVEPVYLPVYAPRTGNEAVLRSPLLDTEIPVRSRVEVIRYTVQSGDSVFAIASRFDVKPETVLWGSYDTLKDDPHSLAPGMELTILPIDGTYHVWKTGDSLESVADFYGVRPSDIVEWPGNGLSFGQTEVEPGTRLVIPGGERAMQQWLVPTIARGSAGVGSAYGSGACSGSYSGAVGTGGFIWPSGNHYLSGNDYWSGHLAIDIALNVGTRVNASDSGVVVFAGWANNGYGYMVMIDHGNGWQTLYAHLSAVSVRCGQSVAQGQQIGAGGSSGNSTGAHLHFEVRFNGGYVNPWYVLP